VSSDTYLTIEQVSQGLFKDKGSKFIAYAYPVSSEQDVKLLVEACKKEHHSAKHHCWAYRLGKDGKVWRANDDGEPANTAGKPILGQLQSKQLTNILVIVVRYFGGTLLGTSGLINAYREAALDALTHAHIVETVVEHTHVVSFTFETMYEVLKTLKNAHAKIISQAFENECNISFSIRLIHEADLLAQLHTIGTIIID